MKLAFVAPLFALMAACSAPLQRGAPIPVLNVMAQAAARPFICASYDARTDTCETVSTVRVNGSRISYDTQLAVNYAGAPVALRVQADSLVRGVEECFDGKSARVTVDSSAIPDAEAKLIKTVLLETYAIYDGLCGTHYATSGEGYFFIVNNEKGIELPALSAEVRFFAERKPLRFRGQ